MERTLIGTVIAGIILIAGKIIWDWLKSKHSHGGDCERLRALEMQFHEVHVKLISDVSAITSDVAVIKNDMLYIKKKLDLNGKAT